MKDYKQVSADWVACLLAALTLSGCLSNDSAPAGADDEPPPPATNRAPSISGTPGAAVSVGNRYSFMPDANDPDGDTLTFSVQNLPEWTTFNSETGAISGGALLGDIGTYSNIVVTVSDGSASSSLQSFDVEVVQVANGSVSLNWSPPTQNSDGSTLIDLAGYRIYYGVSQGSYPNTVVINDPARTSVLIDDLVPDTYYFVGTALNSDGIESDFSSVLVRSVN